MTVLWVIAAVSAGLAMVVAVPWALRRVGEDANAVAWQRYWPVVGVIGAVSLLLPRGGLGVGCAFFYAAASAAFALSVPARLVRRRPLPLTEPAAIGALLSPLAAAVLLVIERISATPEPALLAWVCTLHVIGFALTTVLARRVAVAAVAGGQVRQGALGAALLGWAPLLGSAVFFVAPWPATAGCAVAVGAGLVLALRGGRIAPAEPCSAQAVGLGDSEHHRL